MAPELPAFENTISEVDKQAKITTTNKLLYFNIITSNKSLFKLYFHIFKL